MTRFQLLDTDQGVDQLGLKTLAIEIMAEIKLPLFNDPYFYSIFLAQVISFW